MAKKPTNPVQRAFDDLEQLVTEAFEESAATQASAKKTGAGSIRSGQQRQAAKKKVGAARIKEGQQRQAATKQAVRARRTKSS